MKVYEAVANAFVKEGASTIFGLMGDGNMLWWLAIAKHTGVKLIDVRDEGAGLAMAEGWARASDKIGLCSVTQGPGITRMATSLVVATKSRAPLVVYTSKSVFNDDTVTQSLNQDRFVSATGAGYIEVLTPSFAENAVRQAFHRARLESRPIVLCIPIDIQKQDCDSEGDDYQPSSMTFPRQQRIRPELERLQEALDIISASRKPVVVLGRGAMEAQARTAAGRLAQRIGALIATTLVAKGTLAESEYHAGISGLFSTRSVMQLFAEADCVIAVGASLNPRTIAGGYLYPNARIVHIDVAPHVMLGNAQGADCYLQGDAAATLQEIDAALAAKNHSIEGYRTAAVRRILRDGNRDPGEFEIEPGTTDPREVARIMDERLPSNVALVSGLGHCFAFAAMGMTRPRAGHMFFTDFGCIGQGLANGIGVAVARNAPVVCVEGDGGAMQNIQELDTAARLKAKLLYVILNDEGFGAEYHMMRAKQLDPAASLIPSPDFVAVAKGFSIRGRRATTLDDVAAGIDEFLEGEGPMVLDVRISRNVTSIQSRRLHFGQDV